MVIGSQNGIRMSKWEKVKPGFDVAVTIDPVIGIPSNLHVFLVISIPLICQKMEVFGNIDLKMVFG